MKALVSPKNLSGTRRLQQRSHPQRREAASVGSEGEQSRGSVEGSSLCLWLERGVPQWYPSRWGTGKEQTLEG